MGRPEVVLHELRKVLACPFELMKFRLTFDGELKAAGHRKPRRDEKWAIRKQLIPQLEKLWKVHPALQGLGLSLEEVSWGQGPRIVPKEPRFVGEPPYAIEPGPERKIVVDPKFEIRAEIERSIVRGNRRFLPLVRKSLDLTCSLDILFLRQSEPGDLIRQDGDIDNRLKTLFDALSVPEEQDVRPGDLPVCADLDPIIPERNRAPQCLCLLESDALITGVAVTTDRLLTAPDATPSTVRLVIGVTVNVARLTALNIGFIGD